MKRILRQNLERLCLILVVCGLYVSQADAVCPRPHPKICGEFFKGDTIVFVGTVQFERTSIEGWTYSVNVQRMFRGPKLTNIQVFTENSSGRFPLIVGKRYLLFATRVQGRWEITNCGNSGLVSDSHDKIRQIERLGKSSNGTIEGRVGLEIGIRGSRIIARGGGKTFETVTDENGEFRLNVPPGRYQAEVDSYRVYPFDLSYDDPNDFIVPRGGCAQLQFVASG